MKSTIKFVKILIGAILIFSILLFLPLVLGLGFIATLGVLSWLISKVLNQDLDD